MPMFDLQCIDCGMINEDVIIGLSEFYEKKSNVLNLEHLGIKCIKCECTEFRRLLAAHAKTDQNWSKWQRKPGEV